MTNATNDNHVYKILRLTGTSGESVEAAVRNAIGKAAETVRRLRWFKVVETRGDIAEGHVIHWQVTLDAGFRLDGSE